MLRWSDAAGSIGFLAQLAGGGYQNSCQTTNTSCAFQNLPCGSDLNFTVVAQGAQCNSSQGVGELLQTGNICHLLIYLPTQYITSCEKKHTYLSRFFRLKLVLQLLVKEQTHTNK